MYPPYWVSSKEGTFQNGEILFSQSLFYGEKTQLLKGGCRIAPIRTKPSKKARQGHGSFFGSALMVFWLVKMTKPGLAPFGFFT